MKRRGRIVAIDEGRAVVCFELRDACEKCEAKAMCQAAGSKHTVSAENSLNGQVGDDVFVEQAPAKALVSAFLIFGLPVLLAVVGLILGARLSETLSLLCGITGFALGLIVAKIVDNLLSQKAAFLPRVTEIIKEDDA